MAMIFDSDEENVLEGMVEDEDSEDDEDYVPERGSQHSDSDPDFDSSKASSKRKAKSPNTSRPVKTRSTRGSTNKSSITETTKSAKKSPDKAPVKTVSKSTPRPATRRQSSIKESSDDSSNIVSPLRRKSKEMSIQEIPCIERRRHSTESSRSTRRSVSYADADLSNEEFDEEDDLLFVKKKEEDRKRHADELWSSFKQETSKKQSRKNATPKKIQEITDDNKTTDIDMQSKTKDISTNQTESKNKDTKNENMDTKESRSEPKDTEMKNGKSNDSAMPVKDKTENSKNENNISHNPKEIQGKAVNSLRGADGRTNSLCILTASINKAENKDSTKNSPNPSESGTENLKESVANDGQKIAGVKTEKKSEENLAEKAEAKGKDNVEGKPKRTDESPKPEDAEKALQSKQIITESYDFAGEEIKVTKLVGNDLVRPKTVEKSAPAASGLSKVSSLKRPGGGLANVMGSLEKRKKMSVLDKTKLDWDSYKDSEGIEDELKANRNAGYLDKQEFLQRVDYKQWENEREMRLYSNRK